MKNRINVYTNIGGDTYTCFCVATSPLSETERAKNHIKVLTLEEAQHLRENDGSFFVYNTLRHKYLREKNNYYFESTRPWNSGYVFALIQDVTDAYIEAANFVREHSDKNTGPKAWVRLSRRVAIGVAETLKCMGIPSKISEEYCPGCNTEYHNWHRVRVDVELKTMGVVHFSFDPLSTLRQQLEAAGDSSVGLVEGHDVLLYEEGSRNCQPVITFENLLVPKEDRQYKVCCSIGKCDSVPVWANDQDEEVKRELRRWEHFVELDAPEGLLAV